VSVSCYLDTLRQTQDGSAVPQDGRGRTGLRLCATEPRPKDLRLIIFEEGAAAQVLHVGPYATEAPTIARLHEFIREQGFTFDGHRHKHHEIYLGTHAG
jgi:effector-binding domain-containing protein